MTDTLKPCPFCGNVDIFMEPDERGSGGQWVYPIHVGCSVQTGCGATICATSADTKAEAAAAWNTRTMDDTPDARLAKPALGEEAMIEVREALIHARDTFYRYAKLHQAKCTDEGDEKACVNASMGEEMSRALDAMNAACTMDDTPDCNILETTEEICPRHGHSHSPNAVPDDANDR